MFASLPARVDAERMVAGRRSFEGALLIAELPRLAEALLDDRGDVTYRLDFEQGELGGLELHVVLHAGLTLECQRTLEPFQFPAEVDIRLGLLDDEDQVAELPGNCEPLLLEAGALSPRTVIEDELLLALPLVPTRPDSEMPQGEWSAPVGTAPEAGQRPAVTHPFAGLRNLLATREKHDTKR